MAPGMLLNRLRAAKNAPTKTYDADLDPWFQTHLEVAKLQVVAGFPPPPYGKRGGFMPRRLEHFQDGGAFPEIHVGQYPLDMGKEVEKADGKIIPVSVDAQGRIAFDVVVKHAENARTTVFSQHSDLVPKVPTEVDTEKPSAEEVEATTARTKAALEKVVEDKLRAAQPKSVPSQSSAPQFISYIPSQQSAAYNSGANQRVILMVEMAKDPLESPKFKHKKVPKASGLPPVPVMHSPPRPVTVKDQQDWKIPPCISDWKNPKGYTIPLDKRLAADGRGRQEVRINDNFAKLTEALYVGEQKAREAVAARSKIQQEVLMKEKEKKENELRMLAQRSRMERAGVGAPPTTGANATAVTDRGGAVACERKADDVGVSNEDRIKETREERQERLKREALREDRRRERERERRLEAKDVPAGKKSKITRDRNRDISEKMALGMANTGAGGGELTYDRRLFNQEKGMESGFAAGDTYNVYDKGLFTSQSGLSGLYRPRRDTNAEVYGGNAEEQLDKVLNTDRFRAGKGFAGATERAEPRDRPVESEKDDFGDDPFGLNTFLIEVKKGKKALDKVGEGGTMRASAGSGNKDSYAGGPRNRVDFEREGGGR